MVTPEAVVGNHRVVGRLFQAVGCRTVLKTVPRCRALGAMGYWYENKGSPRGSTMRVNLIMAMCWIILGVPLVILGLIEDDGGNIRVGNSQIDVQFMGWMALVLAAYNLLRWYASRAVRGSRQSIREEM